MSLAAPTVIREDALVFPGAETSGRSWLLAIVATLTMAVSYADRQALAVLAPTVTKALNISDAEYGWLLSAFSAAYLVAAPMAGRWIDRTGARRGLLRAVLVWSVVAALHALVPGLAVLFLLRIALGVAEAPSFPGAAQTIHRVLAPADRPRGFGILFIGSSLGAMFVPPVASKLEHLFNYRVAFLGTALVGLLWVPFWLVVTRTSEARARLDRTTETAPQRAMSMLEGLRHPAVIRSVILTLAISPTMSYALNWSAKLLVASYGVTQEGVGKLLWLPPVLYDLGSIGFGIAASTQLRKHGSTAGPPRLLITASLILALILALVPFARTPWTATILLGLAMAGGGGLFALNTADLLSRVPAGAVSTAAGISAGAQGLAYIIANPLVGWGVQSSGHASVTWALGLWLIPGCLVWLLWPPPPRVAAA